MRRTIEEVRRPRGTERPDKKGWYRRLTLRRSDNGLVYLDRWGFGHDRIGRVMLHKMSAPDPGPDLHDHPWSFVSVVMWGGYTERRADIREAVRLASTYDVDWHRGETVEHRTLSARLMRLDECHTITDLHRKHCWTLVIGGPRRRQWGFYTPEGYVPQDRYVTALAAEGKDADRNRGLRLREVD